MQKCKINANNTVYNSTKIVWAVLAINNLSTLICLEVMEDNIEMVFHLVFKIDLKLLEDFNEGQVFSHLRVWQYPIKMQKIHKVNAPQF